VRGTPILICEKRKRVLGQEKEREVAEEMGEFWDRLGKRVEVEPGPYWEAERGRTQAT
jgi:hypothetical protein